MKVVYTFILVFFLYSCNDKVNYEKPEGLISKEEMTDLLYEMHLAVGTSNVRNIHLEKNRNYMSLVYEKYGIDSTQFAESNIYYTSNIDDYEEIYEEVQRRLDTLKKFHQHIMDSISGIPTNGKNRSTQMNKDSLAKFQKRRN